MGSKRKTGRLRSLSRLALYADSARWVAVLGFVAFSVIGMRGQAIAHSSLQMTGTTERASVDSSAGQAAGGSFDVAISANGRFVAFQSTAANLVLGDTNSDRDVFVHDRQTGTTERVSVDSVGTQGNLETWFPPAISADGRFVVFGSRASNLVPGDTNDSADVFVHDRQTGTTERDNVDSSGAQANDWSQYVDISANGRFVAFASGATNLVSGDTNNAWDVFVHDRQTGATERVSVDSLGAQGNDGSFYPKLSSDGRFVAFWSQASNLVPGDTNALADIFVHDRQTGATERVSVDSSGGQLGASTAPPAFSADARFVAFNLGAAVLVRDRETAITERVDVDSFGHVVKGSSGAPAISGDGHLVAFTSDARLLVPGDTNHLRDVFVHDRKTGRTARASVDSFGAQANGVSLDPKLNFDGSLVAFPSIATNLVPGDTNSDTDVFVRTRKPPIIDSFMPTSGITGSKVTINGANLDATTKVSIHGVVAKFTILSPTQIRVTVPNGATGGKIAVDNLDGTDNSASDYAITFSIVDLSPTSGPAGTVVTLYGIGFNDVTSIKFQRVSATFTILSPTSIQATVPTGATTGTVKATSPQGTVTGPRFTIAP